MNISCNDLLKKLDEKCITNGEIHSQANIYLEANNYAEAYPYVKAVALTNKKSISDKLIAGIVAVSLKKQNDAVEMFSSVIEQDPHNYDAHYNLALLDINKKKYDKAYARLEQLVELNEKNAELQNDLAVIATFKKNSIKAFIHWNKALEINPNDSASRNNAIAYALENNFTTEAVQLLKLNKKASCTNTKAIAEINHWQEIIDSKNSNLNNDEEIHNLSMN